MIETKFFLILHSHSFNFNFEISQDGYARGGGGEGEVICGRRVYKNFGEHKEEV